MVRVELSVIGDMNREQKIFQRVIQARRDRERRMRAREQGYRPTFVNPTVVPIQASW